MNTHNICFPGELKKKKNNIYWLKKVPYLKLCLDCCSEISRYIQNEIKQFLIFLIFFSKKKRIMTFHLYHLWMI